MFYIHVYADVIALVDVIANVLWQMFKPLRQMLLPLLCWLGRCYSLFLLYVEGVKPHYLLCPCCSSWSWLMLLPSGRWNCHCRVVAGRCYCQWADGIALVNYYNFSSEMLNRTSSQICGRWYLPMFLFRDRSLTLIYRASLMVLIRFWSSLPTMSKFSMLILWPVVL